MQKPNYAPLHGDFVTEAPFLEKGVTFYNFIVEGNRNYLQLICDSWFNTPSNGEVHIQPLLDDVIMTFADYESAGSIVTPYVKWGTAPYKELIFSFFVVSLDKTLGIWVAERIYAFVPYIFVDNEFAMKIGNEVLGMPKAMARFKLPADVHDPNLDFSADVYTLLKFKPETKGSWEPFVSLTQNSKSIPHAWEHKDEALEYIKKTMFPDVKIPLPGPGIFVEIAEMIFDQKFPFISLKQFRDATDSSKACYQAIIDFSCDMQKFKGAGLLSTDYKLKISDSALFPVAQDFGLDPENTKIKFAFWLKWDFLFETGHEIWNAETSKKTNQ